MNSASSPSLVRAEKKRCGLKMLIHSFEFILYSQVMAGGEEMQLFIMIGCMLYHLERRSRGKEVLCQLYDLWVASLYR